MSYKKIMLALCCRGDETAVIKEAAYLSKIHNAELLVIHINEPHAGDMSMMMDNPEKKINIEDIKNLFNKAGFKGLVKTENILIISHASVQNSIIEASREADLLVIGHRRANFFKQNLFDSIDEGIVNHAECPILVVAKKSS